MNILKTLAFASVLVPVSGVLAQETAAEQPISAESAKASNAEITAKVGAKEILSKAFAEFADELGVSYGDVTPDGRFYSKGQAVVNSDPASPQFIKSRSMAYERAYMNAVSQFILDFYGRQVTQKLNEYYGNNSSDAEDSPIAKAKGIGEKIKLLADAKLNTALAGEGVPPEKYAQAGVVEKRKLLGDVMAVHNSTKALHASSGCIPVKTFESRGEDGRYYIGVVVRYDETSKTLASCFKAKRRPAISRSEGLTVKQALPAPGEMTENFGVRLYFDETGTPALLSFGQFGTSYTGKSPALAERAEEQAIRQAKALADAGLTTFINSFMDACEESTVSEELSNSIVFTDDGNATPEDAQKITDIYRKSVKQTGSDTMAGRSTVFEEMVKHPNGHKVAMVVRRWSFGTVDAIRALDNPKRNVKPAVEAPAVQREGAGVRKGRTYDF